MKDHHHALSYHQVLGVPENATLEEIRAKYKQLVWHFHPDRIHDQEEKLYRERRLKEINEAYNTLKNVSHHQKIINEPTTEASHSQHSSQNQEYKTGDTKQFIYHMGKRLFFSIPFHLVLMLVVFIMLFRGPLADGLFNAVSAMSENSLDENQSESIADKTKIKDPNSIQIAQTTPKQNSALVADSSLKSETKEQSTTVSQDDIVINQQQWISSNESLSSMILKTSSEYTVNARADATTNSEVLEVLAPDTHLTVVGRSPNNSWLYVILPDGQRAWVFTEVVTDSLLDIQTLPMVHPNRMGVMAVISEQHDVNARSAPHTEGTILKVLPSDSEIVIIGRTADDEWLHIALSEGVEAWVFAELITIDTKTLSTLSVVKAPPLVENKIENISTKTSKSAIVSSVSNEVVSNIHASQGMASVAETSSTNKQTQIDVYATSITSDSDGYATLPVFVSSNLAGLGIHSYDFIVQFDPDILKFVAVSNEESLSSEWRYSYQLVEPGMIRIIESGEQSLVGSGTLLHLIFQVSQQSNKDTDLILKQFSFDGISANIIENGYFAQTPNAKSDPNDKT